MPADTNTFSQEDIKALLNDKGGGLDWNWRERFVEPTMGSGSVGSFLSADSTLVCVGPPIATSRFSVKRLGLSPGFSLSQQVPQQRIAEIGSKRVHILNGTPVGGGSIQRFLYNGDTLLKASYGHLFNPDGTLGPNGQAGLMKSDITAWNNMVHNNDMIASVHNGQKFWISLWDDKVKFPVGLAVYFQDQMGNAIGGFYIEGVKYSAHSVSQQASQLMLAESLNFSFDRVIPIANSVTLGKK